MPHIHWEPARGQRVPVYVWARDVSEGTLRQLLALASRPYVTARVCGMADAHVAEGVSVGTVFATEHEVVPSALGGDLGCGILAVSLSVPAHRLEREVLERFVELSLRAIPAGDQTHRGAGRAVPDALFAPALSTNALEKTRLALARRHLGTLGGGNHFLEIDRDPEGGAWLLVHSGSRGLGGAIAAHHRRAGESLRGDEAARYLADLDWALAFAKANRRALASRALDVLSEVLGEALSATREIDVHHNFVAREIWDDRELFVHRKGAIAIPRGGLALVPGSMATASYVVEGLGSDLAFDSCSHGAGRVMTRGEARRKVAPKALERTMRRIVWPAHLSAKLVEEAPDVYRDIGDVLDDQVDLVRRRVRLEPLAVLKG